MSGIIESGSIRTLRTSIRGARGGPDGLLEQLVAGGNYATGRLDVNSPFQYLPDSEAALRRTFMYHWYSGAQLLEATSTTDGGSLGAGTGGSVFGVNTNSATATATSTQAGYQGQTILTTGGTTANHAGFIGTPGFLDVANQLAVCYASIYVPDCTSAFDLYIGFSNKTIAPGTSGTYMTDGAVCRAITSTSLTFKLDTASNAANNDQATNHTVSSALKTMAAGAAQSWQVAIVLHGQASADLLVRDPSTATNTWSKVNQTTNIPRNSVVLRPHLMAVTRYSGTTAVHIQDFAYWWLRPTTW